MYQLKIKSINNKIICKTNLSVEKQLAGYLLREIREHINRQYECMPDFAFTYKGIIIKTAQEKLVTLA